MGKEGYRTSSPACLDSPYAGQCTFCTTCTRGAHHTHTSQLIAPLCTSSASNVATPLSPSCAARHQKTLHLGRPRLETERGMCAEKVLGSSSSFATLVVLHSSSSTVPAGGRREGWLVGGGVLGRRASRESETL